MATKERLHRLVDELPECEVPAAERFLEYLRNIGSDPLVRAFMAAPVDDEPVTDEEAAAIGEAEAEIARGDGRWRVIVRLENVAGIIEVLRVLARGSAYRD